MTFTTVSNARQPIEPVERTHVAESARARRPDAVRTLTSDQLFTGHGEVQIEHRGAVYRLKQTSLGKLILTK